MFICMKKMKSIAYFFFEMAYFENAWSWPSIMTPWPCRKFWCPKCWNQLVGNFDVYLHAKNELYPTCFLRYCKDVANLLFWKLWKCLTIHIKNQSINFCIQKTNFITHFFLKLSQRNSKLVILGNLSMPDHTHLKW